ncbi:MAG: YCF48-related protein [Ignavibacteriaceae bacterium]|nr:YCF48-related protein [Ignavibacteriaceae bacterium]
MKTIYKLLIVLLFSSVLSAQDFSVVLTPYFKDFMNDISFPNDQTGWMCGYNGYIYKTTNGGVNWSQQNSGVTKNIQKLFFLDENNGYAGTVAGSILKTSDGGNNWIEYIFSNLRPTVPFGYLDDLFFINKDTGFVVAGALKNFFLFKTTDGGVNWAIKDSLISTDNTVRWYDMSFFNDSLGAVVSSKKNLQKYTTDGGETWSLSTAINDNFFGIQHAVRWLSQNTLISMGEGNEFNGVPVPIYKSTDGGINWVKKNQSVITCFDRVKDVFFKNSNEGIGVGSNGFYKGFVIKTSDGGENWATSVTNYAASFVAIDGSNNTLFGLGPSSHVLKSTDFGDNWNMLPFTSPTSIYGLYFDQDKGFALTAGGDFYVSRDGTGQNWEYLSNTGPDNAYSMFFFNKTTGLVLEENQNIVKTTDGGQTWRTVLAAVPYGSRNKVGGITFGDQTTGYAWFSLNDYGDYFVFKSTDAGENWNKVLETTGPGYIQGNIVFFDANTGVILGPQNYKMRTTDGGQTWDTAFVNNFPSYLANKGFEDVVKLSSTKAVAVGDHFICMTTDQGLNWNYIDHKMNGIDSSFWKINFSGPDTGYIGSPDSVYYKTSDGGFTWQKDSLNGKYGVYAVGTNAAGSIFFGTGNGYILGKINPTGVNENGKTVPGKYSLKQNYPNPFNPSTVIEYSIAELNGGSSFVQLKVFNVLGKEIATLVNSYQPAGNYKVEFNANKLASGIYFYRLKAGNFIETRKLILMK